MERARRKIYEVAESMRPEGFTGADVINAKKLFAGTMYPLLYSMEKSGYLSSDWGEPREADGLRPKLYWMTAKGLSEFRNHKGPLS